MIKKYSIISNILVANVSHYTVSNEANSVALDVFNLTASCISNPICFDDQIPTSRIHDSTAPKNVFKLTASKESNFTTSSKNLILLLAVSNILVEASNSECPAL